MRGHFKAFTYRVSSEPKQAFGSVVPACLKVARKKGGEALIIGAQKKAKKPVKINVLAKITQKTKARKCRSLGAWSADASGFQNTS